MMSLPTDAPESPSDLEQLLKNRFAEGQSTRLISRYSAEPGNLSLQSLNGLIDYPHRDMTITVQAGMTVQQLQKVLREQGQWLPLDVPFPEQTTLAEALLFHLYGSLSEGYGTLRDCLLGMSVCDGRGRLFHSGGRVVKNVAGYDLCKMLIGSRGSWAIPCEITLRLQPIPSELRLLHLQLADQRQAQSTWTTLRQQTIPLVVFDYAQPQGIFTIGLAGSSAVNDHLTKQIQQSLKLARIDFQSTSELWTEGQSCWQQFSTETTVDSILRWGLRPSQVVDCLTRLKPLGLTSAGLAGRGVVLIEAPADSESLQRHELKELAKKLSATCQTTGLYQRPFQQQESTPVDQQAGLSDIHQRWKKLFDPRGLFAEL